MKKNNAYLMTTTKREKRRYWRNWPYVTLPRSSAEEKDIIKWLEDNKIPYKFRKLLMPVTVPSYGNPLDESFIIHRTYYKIFMQLETDCTLFLLRWYDA